MKIERSMHHGLAVKAARLGLAGAAMMASWIGASPEARADYERGPLTLLPAGNLASGATLDGKSTTPIEWWAPPTVLTLGGDVHAIASGPRGFLVVGSRRRAKGRARVLTPRPSRSCLHRQRP